MPIRPDPLRHPETQTEIPRRNLDFPIALVVIGGIALGAELAARALGGVVSPIMIGLLFGLTAGHLLPTVGRWATGADFVATRVLRLGIVLIGLRTTLDALVEPGVVAIIIAVGGMVLIGVVAAILGPVLTKTRNGWVLLAVGTAICGNSAIIATAPVIKARDREVALAVGLVTAFGTLALFAYPLIGAALGMNQTAFGTWAGTGINDTAQVVAAGEAYGPVAATRAVTVKFVRNMLILPVVAGLAFVTRTRDVDADGESRPLPWLRAIPPFVLGFLAMAAVASLGLLSSEVTEVGRVISTAFITAGMVAIGLRTRLAEMRTLGWAPLLLGLTLSLSLSAFSFVMVNAIL